MRPCDKVVWSLLGAGGEPVTEWGDMEEVIRQAKMFENITGGVFYAAKHLLTVFGDRGINAILDQLGFITGEVSENKFKFL